MIDDDHIVVYVFEPGIVDDEDRAFSVRVLGVERDGFWDGFVELRSDDGACYLAPEEEETRHKNLRDLINWAESLTATDYEQALDRAVAARAVARRLTQAPRTRPSP